VNLERYERWFSPRLDRGAESVLKKGTDRSVHAAGSAVDREYSVGDRVVSPLFPSGLRDLPRAFVIRASEQAEARFEFGFHLFDVSAGGVDVAVRAFQEFLEIESAEGRAVLRLALDSDRAVSRVRVSFVTPTELKGSDRPEFGVLFARLRDRISTLRALYQEGPLEIDFKGMAERAARVKMTRCEIEHVDAERVSRNTGQRHSLGGFVGVAEYAGDLGEFLPYLEIGRYTGVGRQTVWGKGEIHAVVE
jgi:hypothetical protein